MKSRVKVQNSTRKAAKKCLPACPIYFLYPIMYPVWVGRLPQTPMLGQTDPEWEWCKDQNRLNITFHSNQISTNLLNIDSSMKATQELLQENTVRRPPCCQSLTTAEHHMDVDWASSREAERMKSSSFCHGSSCYFPEEMLLVLPGTQRTMPQNTILYILYILHSGYTAFKIRKRNERDFRLRLTSAILISNLSTDFMSCSARDLLAPKSTAVSTMNL